MSLPLTKEQKLITMKEMFGAVMIDHLVEIVTTGEAMREAQIKFKVEGRKKEDALEAQKWVAKFDQVLWEIKKSFKNQTPKK